MAFPSEGTSGYSRSGRMGREPLISSLLLSLCVHLLVLVGVQLTYTLPDRGGIARSVAPLAVELRFGSAAPLDARPVIAAAPREDPKPPTRVPPPPAEGAEAEASAGGAKTLHGVKLATKADVLERRAEQRKDDPRTESKARAEKPEPERRAVPPSEEVRSSEEPEREEVRTAARQTTETVAGPMSDAPGGSHEAPPRSAARFARDRDRRVVTIPGRGGFRPDTPGYQGRIFAQVSVRGKERDTFFDRIHLFREHEVYRDYSDQSLFGYSFRHEFGGDLTREFQVGRVRTHGAYLIVTDLFPSGRISTMGHTVILAFPRDAGTGGDLYEVVQERSGHFRLRGPGGSWLLFDGRRGNLRGAAGFYVRPPGYEGTPPRVAFRGLHVRIHSVGGNPFLRGRRAVVVDDRGVECHLSTSDLFAYPSGRPESDMFRFSTDREFFSFLGSRCPGLDVPSAPDVELVERRRHEPVREKPERPAKAGGLLPSLFGGG